MREGEELAVLAAAWELVMTPDGLRRLAEGTQPVPDVVADDFVMVNFKEWPIVGPYEGRDGYRRWARDTFEPVDGGHFIKREPPICAAPGIWVLRITARGRLKETGMEVAYPMYAVNVVRDGKLVRSHGFLDLDEAMTEAQRLAESA